MCCSLRATSVPWKRKRCSDEDRERERGSAVSHGMDEEAWEDGRQKATEGGQRQGTWI